MLNLSCHCIVNMVPAIVRKNEPADDLPIDLGIMIRAGFLPLDCNENSIAISDVSPDIVVGHVRGPWTWR